MVVGVEEVLRNGRDVDMDLSLVGELVEEVKLRVKDEVRDMSGE